MSEQEGRSAAAEERATMRYWLGRTLKELRKTHGVSRESVRMLARGRDGTKPPDLSTITRFENGETWPRNIDILVSAYGQICGVEDARQLWYAALEQWTTRGIPPTIGELTPAARSLLHALEAAQRKTPYDDESQDKPNATQKRRGAG